MLQDQVTSHQVTFHKIKENQVAFSELVRNEIASCSYRIINMIKVVFDEKN